MFRTYSPFEPDPVSIEGFFAIDVHLALFGALFGSLAYAGCSGVGSRRRR